MKNFTMRSADCWPMHGNVSSEVLNKMSFRGRELLWGKIPENQKNEINFIELIPDVTNGNNIPDIIKTLPNLKGITIPTRFVPFLKSKSIPKGVETLIVGLLSENKKNKVDWCENEIFSNVLELQGVGREVSFTSYNFPNLTHLHINIGKKESEFDEIVSLSKLQSLIVEKTLTLESVNKLSKTNIEYLMLLSGKFPSLNDLSDMKRLSKLEIRFCTLNDLNGIQNISCVNDVEIFGCTKITDIKPLANSKSIKRVHILGCSSKWNDRHLPDYFKSKGFTDIRYEPDRSNSLFEAIRT